MKQNIIYPRKIGSYPGERIKKIAFKTAFFKAWEERGREKGRVSSVFFTSLVTYIPR